MSEEQNFNKHQENLNISDVIHRNFYIMKLKNIKYLTKLIIAYPSALLLGIIGYRKGFDNMIIWLNKGI